MMSFISAVTSSVPRIFLRMWRAFGMCPRSARLLGVSGRRMAARVRMTAGSPARARDVLQP